MPHEIVMPRLGWASEEGTLIEWLKKDGDPVRSGDIVCIIESDKAQVEVESFDAGVLRIPPTSPAPGAKVPVGTVLGYVLAPGEALPSHGPARAVAVSATGDAARETAVAVAAEAGAVDGAGQSASPRARRLAAELRVDWRALKGTGRTGRIVERDVRAAGADRPSAVRRLIGERMSASARTTAPSPPTSTAPTITDARIKAPDFRVWMYSSVSSTSARRPPAMFR